MSFVSFYHSNQMEKFPWEASQIGKPGAQIITANKNDSKSVLRGGLVSISKIADLLALGSNLSFPVSLFFNNRGVLKRNSLLKTGFVPRVGEIHLNTQNYHVFRFIRPF